MAYIAARYDDPQLVFENEDGSGDIVVEDYLKTPDFAAVAQIVAEPIERLTAFVGLKYTGTQDVLNNRTGTLVRAPDFLVTNVSVTRHFPVRGTDGDIDLTAGVKNVFNDRQRDLEVGASRDSDFVYGPRLLRTLFVRIDAHF